jgi:hypothetical protein
MLAETELDSFLSASWQSHQTEDPYQCLQIQADARLVEL